MPGLCQGVSRRLGGRSKPAALQRRLYLLCIGVPARVKQNSPRFALFRASMRDAKRPATKDKGHDLPCSGQACAMQSGRPRKTRGRAGSLPTRSVSEGAFSPSLTLRVGRLPARPCGRHGVRCRRRQPTLLSQLRKRRRWSCLNWRRSRHRCFGRQRRFATNLEAAGDVVVLIFEDHVEYLRKPPRVPNRANLGRSALAVLPAQQLVAGLHFAGRLAAAAIETKRLFIGRGQHAAVGVDLNKVIFRNERVMDLGRHGLAILVDAEDGVAGADGFDGAVGWG